MVSTASSSGAPPADKPTKSAFSRFTNYVPKALPSSTSSPTASSSGSQASSGPAHNALESLALALASDAADGRLRQPSVESSRRRSRESSLGSTERRRERELSQGPGGGGIDGAPASTAGTGSSWGGESLPPNASNFSAYAGASGYEGEGAFFPHGGSSFSFDGQGSSYAASSSSPSIFRDRFAVPDSSSGPGGSYFSRAGGSTSWMNRSASHGISGGAKAWEGRRKDVGRGMKHSLTGPIVGDRGVVAIAKPREGDSGRVAIAGKTYLRILKVPSGERSAPNLERPATSFKSSSSLAYRRSQSRTSVPTDHRSDSADSNPSQVKPEEQVSETMDVRLGSRLGSGFLFTDVRWGFGATANKVATSFSNGAVVLWDLERDGTSRVDQLKYEHDRAVNRVAFGGASGSWLLSAGQDGQMKFWDVRDSKPASLVLKAASPVRHVAFSPSAAQPFTLLAACSSGTLIRYDIRFTGRQGGGATDRIAGHVGACLAMDWRDNLDSHRGDGDRREGGWVATGGSDGFVKIWDFSLATLSTKPVRTLYSSQPVQVVAWHPTKSTELASAPMPPLSVTVPTDETTSASGSEDASAWRNEIEIWDTREVYFPKYSIKTEDPTSSIIYNDANTIWSGSKSSATFLHLDVENDSYSMLDSVSRPSASWNCEGELAFADDTRHPFNPARDLIPSIPVEPEVDEAVFHLDSSIGTIPDFDADFSATSFAYLATHCVLAGSSLHDICETNAEASFDAGRSDAGQLWTTIKIWLDSPPPSPAPSPVVTSRPTLPPIPAAISPTHVNRPSDWPPSPTAIATSYPTPLKAHPRRSMSNPLSSRLSKSKSGSKSTTNSPVIHPSDPIDLTSKGTTRMVLEDYGGEESTESETERPAMFSSRRGSDVRPLPRSPSDVGDEVIGKGLAPGIGLRGRSYTIAGTNASTTFRPSNLDQDFSLGPSATLVARSQSLARPPRALISSSSSEDDGAIDEEEEEGTDPRLRIAAAKLALAALASRRPSGSGSADRRRGSNGQSASRNASKTVSMDRKGGRPTFVPVEKDAGKSAEEARMTVGVQQVGEVRQVVKDAIVATLKDYAEKGDTQMCAMICCVLRDKSIGLEPMFVARVTKAYLELLRRSQLYTAAASLLKYSPTESLRALSQNSVVYHVTCGTCSKPLDQPPYGICRRCSTRATRCCICHLTVKSLYLFCGACGHGAHPACLTAHAEAYHATGGLDEVAGGDGEGSKLWDGCPEGSCAHTGCALSL